MVKRPKGNDADTVGLYKIVFAKSAEEIDQGRSFIGEALKTRTIDSDTHARFFRLHNFVALTRLLKLARADYIKPM
jgi:nucleoside-diphosphate-sugar epimerase